MNNRFGTFRLDCRLQNFGHENIPILPNYASHLYLALMLQFSAWFKHTYLWESGDDDFLTCPRVVHNSM